MMTPDPSPRFTAGLTPEVLAVLSRLRRQIRQYVFWEGLALIAVLAGLLFWGSFLVDLVYFNVSRLELPRWLRVVFLVATLTSLVGAACTLVLFRALRVIRGRALALLLERRFPELSDGLITAVEAAEGSWSPRGDYEQAMLARTIADAARHVQRLDVGRVFDPLPLRRAAVAAVVLVTSILGLAVVDSSAMERWVDGYWRLRPSYWPRETELVVRVLTQPGDRIRDFNDRQYRHPRGGDLQLVIEAAPGKTLPERLQLDYRLRGGGWKRTYLTTVGDQPFLHAFPSLLDHVELWVSGGDFASSRPWQIEVVDPPRLDGIELAVLYPEYTGLNLSGESGLVQRTTLPLLGAQMTLPIGSDVQLNGAANKSLKSVRVELDGGNERFEWSLARNLEDPAAEPVAQLTLRARDDHPQRVAHWPAAASAQLFSADGRSFVLPFTLRKSGADELRDTIVAAAEQGSPLPPVVPWPADGVLRIHLEDSDGIASPEPIRLTINGQPDEPPIVLVELKGISASITRQARIPVTGLIRDEYGIASVRFEYLVDDTTDWQPRALASPPPAGLREFELARSATEPFERFDVLPLDLSIKQRLALTVVANDEDSLYGPNEQRSQKFVFTIVPVEELLSLLYEKELNLRKRFEQNLSELKDLQQDLALHRERAATLAAATGDERRQTVQALIACAERSLHTIRKDAAEVESIHLGFHDIREELVNNSAETPETMERLQIKILEPLQRITSEHFPAADASLGLFSLANEKGSDPAPAISRSQEDLARLVQAMERVLLEIRTRETMLELLEHLKSLISAESEILEDTKTQRKEKALRALE